MPVYPEVGFNGATKAPGFISPRGSTLSDVGQTSARIAYANTVSHARYGLQKVQSVPTPVPTPIPTNQSFDVLSLSSGQTSFQTSSTDTQTVDLSYVLVQSSLASAFDFSDSPIAPTKTNQFYYITDSVPAGKATQGTIFFRDPTTSNFVPYLRPGATVGPDGRVLTNYVTYVYGPSSVRMQFNAAGIDASVDALASSGAVMAIPENFPSVNYGNSGAFLIDVGYGSQSTPRFTSIPNPGGVSYPAIGYSIPYRSGGMLSYLPSSGILGFVSPGGSQVVSASMSSVQINYSTAFQSPTPTPVPVCVTVGGSLGALYPDNALQCCPGLVPYVQSGIVGNRGICVNPSPTPTAVPNCVDSDNGKNPSVYGKITLFGRPYAEDSCNFNDRPPNTSDNEYWCETPTSTVVSNAWTKCPFGCANGACLVSPTVIPTPTVWPTPTPAPSGGVTFYVPASVSAGSAFSFSWSDVRNASASDWIAIVPVGGNWNNALPWAWTNGVQCNVLTSSCPAPTQLLTRYGGNMTLLVPVNLSSFQVVLYRQGDMLHGEGGRSSVIAVAPSPSVSPVPTWIPSTTPIPVALPQGYVKAGQSLGMPNVTLQITSIRLPLPSANYSDAGLVSLDVWFNGAHLYPISVCNGCSQAHPDIDLFVRVDDITTFQGIPLAKIFIQKASIMPTPTPMSVGGVTFVLPQSVPAGSTLSVVWKDSGTPSETDWIAMVPVDGKWDNSLPWAYTNGLKSIPTVASKGGSVTLAAPLNVTRFQVVLYRQNDMVHGEGGRSGVVTVALPPVPSAIPVPTDASVRLSISSVWKGNIGGLGVKSISIAPGLDVELSWSSTGVTGTCTLTSSSGLNRPVPNDQTGGWGNWDTPNATTSYTITCMGASGTLVSDTVKANVVSPNASVQLSISSVWKGKQGGFGVKSVMLYPGQDVELSWSSSGVSGPCVLTSTSGMNQSVANDLSLGWGNFDVPKTTTSYTIACSSTSGISVSDTVTANVLTPRVVNRWDTGRVTQVSASIPGTINGAKAWISGLFGGN
ncbi:hypothetical protein HY994_00280 [Candidatus Micrarchaeota archaeon]|nr:hypothetical protein [Candidatus Micrarchaeota archaeon]